jgi:hypothetical protein
LTEGLHKMMIRRLRPTSYDFTQSTARIWCAVGG